MSDYLLHPRVSDSVNAFSKIVVVSVPFWRKSIVIIKKSEIYILMNLHV